MEDLRNELSELLAVCDKDTGPLSETDISAAIRSLSAKEEKVDLPFAWVAEGTAFDFYEDIDNGPDTGGYFRPMAPFRREDGTCLEVPSIKNITSQMIQYWAQRAAAAVHPVLKARYANLIWEFQKKVTGTSPSYTVAQTAIDSIVQIAREKSHKEEIIVIAKLRHALALAISLNVKRHPN